MNIKLSYAIDGLYWAIDEAEMSLSQDIFAPQLAAMTRNLREQVRAEQSLTGNWVRVSADFERWARLVGRSAPDLAAKTLRAYTCVLRAQAETLV